MQNYNEKFVEEFIKEYPLDFLGEPLSLYKQQPTIEGLRPDLIFKDEQNNFTIVEVQLNALDRNHLYKTLEYRDLFKEHEKSNTPRIILFCNEIKRQYEKILKIHNINRICMERKKFWDLCVSLKPKLKEQAMLTVDKRNKKKTLKEQSLLTAKEVSGLLKVKEQTIRLWACRKKLPSYKVFGALRFKDGDIEALVNAGASASYQSKSDYLSIQDKVEKILWKI